MCTCEVTCDGIIHYSLSGEYTTQASIHYSTEPPPLSSTSGKHTLCAQKKEKHPFIKLIKTQSFSHACMCVHRLVELVFASYCQCFEKQQYTNPNFLSKCVPFIDIKLKQLIKDVTFGNCNSNVSTICFFTNYFCWKKKRGQIN